MHGKHRHQAGVAAANVSRGVQNMCMPSLNCSAPRITSSSSKLLAAICVRAAQSQAPVQSNCLVAPQVAPSALSAQGLGFYARMQPGVK